MRRVAFQWLPAIVILALTLPVTGYIAAQAQSTKPSAKNAQHILIHMKEYISEIHGAQMGLELADRLQRNGAKVTLWLELRAVRIADDRIVRAATPPGARPFSAVFKSLVDHGAQVLVCRHCADLDEVSQDHLREGAKFATADDVVQAVMEADKILDY